MFVEYESHRAAALARKKLVQGSVFLFGQEIGQVWARVLKLLSTWTQNMYPYYIFPIKIWYTKISTWFEEQMKLSWSANHNYFQVDWAEPEHEVDEETMSTVKVKNSRFFLYLYSSTLYYF